MFPQFLIGFNLQYYIMGHKHLSGTEPSSVILNLAQSNIGPFMSWLFVW